MAGATSSCVILAAALRTHAGRKLTRACWPSTKIMIVGADAGQFTAEDGRDLADDMLQKPFKLAELEERSAKLMRIGGYAA